MKKLLGILVLGLLLSSNAFAGKKWGQGELKLSPRVTKVFIKYIKGTHSKSPFLFAVSKDGLEYQYYYCSQGLNNCQGGVERILEECENYSNGVECGLFARARTIKWENGINKNTRIKSKLSDAEIKAKLTELGFLGGQTSSSVESKKLVDIEFPEALKPFNQEKKENWKEYMSYKNHTKWSYGAWFEIREKNGAEAYGWAADINLRLALKRAKNFCEKSKKKYKTDFTNSEICIVYNINGVETTNEEKIKYAEKFYKKTASESFEKNPWILKKPKLTKKIIKKKKEKKKVTKKTDSKKQKAKDECKELGFTKGTEKFGDCVMKMLSM